MVFHNSMAQSPLLQQPTWQSVKLREYVNMNESINRQIARDTRRHIPVKSKRKEDKLNHKRASGNWITL